MTEPDSDVEDFITASVIVCITDSVLGVEDFDRENAEDPQQHSEYAMETFQYYKNREEAFRVPDYLQVVISHHKIDETNY